jgi:hypothetical protein
VAAVAVGGDDTDVIAINAEGSELRDSALGISIRVKKSCYGSHGNLLQVFGR